MNSETAVVIAPTTELDEALVSDDSIVRINEAFNRLYKKQRQKAITLLRQMPSMLQVVDQLVEGKTYQAVIPHEVLERIRAGSAEWGRRPGNLRAPIIQDRETGQIICQVSLREISPDLLSSLNQLAVQHTLAKIIRSIEVVDQKVTDVLEGQRNDRLALVESGVQLYIQAIAASKSETRHQLLIEAVDKLTVGRQQLIVSMEADIRSLDKQLPRNSWQLVWRSLTGDVSRQIGEKAEPVQTSFQAILRASYVLASAYQALNELDSLQVSLQPLREMLLEIGTKGEEIARWLPYNAARPPEELWHSIPLQLEESITSMPRYLEWIDSQTIELVFETQEMIGVAND